MIKKLLATLFVMCFFVSFSQEQFNYRFVINKSSNEYTLKDMISVIRDNNILCSDIHIEDSLVSLKSTQKFSSEKLQEWIHPMGGEVVSFQMANTGIYFHGEEKQGGVNCSNAGLVCSNATVSGNSGGHGTQELTSSNRGCLSTENQSSWYYVNVGTSGTLEMTIGTSVDYDFAIWGPFTASNAQSNCPPSSAPIRCSFSAEYGNTGLGQVWGVVSTYTYSCGPFGLFTCTGYNYGWVNPNQTTEGASGDGWVDPLNVTAGQVYILLIDNWTSDNTPYNITWGGSAILDCTPVVLPIELASFEGKNKNKQNELRWETITEINSSHFLVERSVDGFVWEQIAVIDAKGTSLNPTRYTYDDDNYEHVVNYYRLNMYDFDGTNKKSMIVTIDNSINSKTLEKVVNSMGQLVKEDSKGLKFYIYTDGTVIKKME